MLVDSNTWTDFIPKPDVFVDIGIKSISGNETLESKIINSKWPDVRIIGFEPHPNRFKDCKNGYPGSLLNFAVGEHDCKSKFYDLDSMAVKYPRDYQDHSKPFEVDVRSLDSLNKEFGSWNNIFIWSDTEGCELDILKGCTGLLSSGKIIGLNLEIWDVFQTAGWATGLEVIKFLSPYGFTIKHEWVRNPKDPHRDVIFLK